ncbi:MAG: hypothetical protein WD775_13930 [Burkholderiales bacterium]
MPEPMIVPGRPAICTLANGKPSAEADNGFNNALQLRSAIEAEVAMTARDWSESLAACGDAASVRTAVSALCAEFGKLTRIDILTMAEAEKRRALCFLRLESAAQERELMTTLGVPRFGDDLLVVVDLQPASALTIR